MAGGAKGDDVDGGDGPAVQLCNIPQVLHAGEVALGDGDGRLFDLTGPAGDDPVPAGGQGKHADAVKEAAQGQRAAVRRIAVVRFSFSFLMALICPDLGHGQLSASSPGVVDMRR